MDRRFNIVVIVVKRDLITRAKISIWTDMRVRVSETSSRWHSERITGRRKSNKEGR